MTSFSKHFSSQLVKPRRAANFLNNGIPINRAICTCSSLKSSPKKIASTFLGSSLANSWASKFSSSSVGTLSLNIRSEKANYTILLIINIKVKKSLSFPCSNASIS